METWAGTDKGGDAGQEKLVTLPKFQFDKFQNFNHLPGFFNFICKVINIG
jgi:hypothetical protein